MIVLSPPHPDLEFRAGFFFSSEVVELEVELKMKLVLKNVVASSDSDLL